MAQVSDCISHMIKGMDARPDVVGAACEALHKMFERNHTELVAQVNSNERVLVSHRHYPFAVSETRRELKPKCVPQLFLGSLLRTRRSAIG